MNLDPFQVVTFTKDNGMVVAPPVQADSSEGSSIRVPQADTSLGADFGEEITDENRFFAATREPIAGFLIYGIAAHIVERWFAVNDASTAAPDPEFDRSVQKELRKLKFKAALTQLVEYERLYGRALLVGAWDDVKELLELADKKQASADLQQLVAYPKTAYSVWSKDEDKTSLRYGLPLIYQVNNGSQTFRVHWTRCFELQTRTHGRSVLDLVWDDLTCGRNIRWGVGQWVYRTGGGFAVIEFPKEYSPAPGKPPVLTTPEQLQTWASSASWQNITHRNYICIIKDSMSFHFEGAQGATLNPEPFFDTNTKQIAKATGYPKSILEGAEAGALTGSEKNDQQFYKQIAGEQAKLEDVNRWVIDQVLEQLHGSVAQVDSGLKSAGSVLKRLLRRVAPAVVKDQGPVEYEIVWNNAFELNAVDQARAELLTEQANQTRLQYKTVDEVRADNNVDPLPLGEGEVVLSLRKPTSQFTTSIPAGSSEGQTGLDRQNSQLPAIRELLKPILKQVFDGHMSHDLAVQQGTALIEFYCNTERERALEYTRSKLQQPTITLSPEQEKDFDDQKARYIADFLNILGKAEALAKAKQPNAAQ